MQKRSARGPMVQQNARKEGVRYVQATTWLCWTRSVAEIGTPLTAFSFADNAMAQFQPRGGIDLERGRPVWMAR